MRSIEPALKAFIVTDGEWYEFWAAYTTGQAKYAVAREFLDVVPMLMLEAFQCLRVRRAKACDHLAIREGRLDWETCARLMGWDVDRIKEEA